MCQYSFVESMIVETWLMQAHGRCYQMTCSKGFSFNNNAEVGRIQTYADLSCPCLSFSWWWLCYHLGAMVDRFWYPAASGCCLNASNWWIDTWLAVFWWVASIDLYMIWFTSKHSSPVKQSEYKVFSALQTSCDVHICACESETSACCVHILAYCPEIWACSFFTSWQSLELVITCVLGGNLPRLVLGITKLSAREASQLNSTLLLISVTFNNMACARLIPWKYIVQEPMAFMPVELYNALKHTNKKKKYIYICSSVYPPSEVSRSLVMSPVGKWKGVHINVPLAFRLLVSGGLSHYICKTVHL